MKKITHKLLEHWLPCSHAAAKAHLSSTNAPWPVQSTPQSDWTLWAHYTFALAMTDIYRKKRTAKMSLRVSNTKKDPDFWTRVVNAGFANDHGSQQMGLDFCLMGPTGARVHYLTGEGECDAGNSVSISLSKRGYIWDWSKLLGNVSEHRLLIAVVGGNSTLPPTDAEHPAKRRADLMVNMAKYFKSTHAKIQYCNGIGGYILAHHHGDRADSYTFIVRRGKISFRKIPATLTLV